MWSIILVDDQDGSNLTRFMNTSAPPNCRSLPPECHARYWGFCVVRGLCRSGCGLAPGVTDTTVTETNSRDHPAPGTDHPGHVVPARENGGHVRCRLAGGSARRGDRR